MLRVLSLDWDFFIDCDFNYRQKYFPEGRFENRINETKDLLWAEKYVEHPSLFSVKVKQDAYKWLKNICKLQACNNCFASESHKDIYKFILKYTHRITSLEIWNLDFHHDYYRGNKGRLTCGNWARRLKRYREYKYYWVKCDDSVTESLDTEVIYKELSDVPWDCDLVFLCRSDLWSPPHLDSKFREVERLLRPHVPQETLLPMRTVE